MREIPPKLMQIAISNNFQPYPVRDGHCQEVGHTYWINYWQKWYTVIDEKNDKFPRFIVCRWSDGTVATHCTPLSSSDWELVPVKPH